MLRKGFFPVRERSFALEKQRECAVMEKMVLWD